MELLFVQVGNHPKGEWLYQSQAHLQLDNLIASRYNTSAIATQSGIKSL